ncbi:MAG: hypothetical protein WBM53_11760 [Maribacter sp.]
MNQEENQSLKTLIGKQLQINPGITQHITMLVVKHRRAVYTPFILVY